MLGLFVLEKRFAFNCDRRKSLWDVQAFFNNPLRPPLEPKSVLRTLEQLPYRVLRISTSGYLLRVSCVSYRVSLGSSVRGKIEAVGSLAEGKRSGSRYGKQKQIVKLQKMLRRHCLS